MLLQGQAFGTACLVIWDPSLSSQGFGKLLKTHLSGWRSRR